MLVVVQEHLTVSAFWTTVFVVLIVIVVCLLVFRD